MEESCHGAPSALDPCPLRHGRRAASGRFSTAPDIALGLQGQQLGSGASALETMGIRGCAFSHHVRCHSVGAQCGTNVHACAPQTYTSVFTCVLSAWPQLNQGYQRNLINTCGLLQQVTSREKILSLPRACHKGNVECKEPHDPVETKLSHG